MSDYGEGIIERLNNGSGLNDTSNPFHQLINNGVGEWLDKFDEASLQEQIFLESAIGSWLDVHGRQYNILRKPDEPDDAYRERIIYESLGHVNAPFLQSVYGLALYCYVEDFDVAENTMTSDNVFACHKYMAFVDEGMQEILEKKFVIGSGLTYLDGGE